MFERKPPRTAVAAAPDPAADAGMRVRTAAFDWAGTPLGPMAEWPQGLRFAAELCGRASVPTAVYWGPDLILLYNDAFVPVLRDRHPGALGRPAAELWHDIWDLLRPNFDEVRETGLGVSVFEQMLPMRRGDTVEETYWNYSLTPLLDEAGALAGILNQGIEITRALLAERRLSFQVAVADRLRGLTDPEAVKQAAAELLGQYLGAARVGYAEVDEAAGIVTVHGDWTRDAATASLAGISGQLAIFGAEALAYLRTGEVITIPDLRALPEGTTVADWDAVGMRALIAVPLVRDGALRALLYVHEPLPRFWKRSDAAMVRDVAERSWAAVERAQAEQSLRESEDHYRHTVELNPQVTWTARPDGHLDRMAPRWEEWTGTSGLGSSWADSLHPDDRAESLAAWRRAIESGEPYDIAHRIRRRDGSWRWARSRAYPRCETAGAILLWYGATEDIHEKKLAEERQRLLINELNHRVKNMLATIQAIAFQTLKGDIPLADARQRFEARLMALARAHSLVTAQNWEGSTLERVVKDATEYLSEDHARFEIAGDPVWLSPRAALALALAFHELSTNAAKYGALSNDSGIVSIGWRSAGGRLRIEWTEKGGPPVAEPARRGFGSRLIERGLAADLDGSARLAFEPEGVICTIEASLEGLARTDRQPG
jgi:PAS domain S-box-containing protein